MATGGTSLLTQPQNNRVHLFRLQMLIIDGGLMLLRSILDHKLTTQNITLAACLNQERSKIKSLKSKGIITQTQYELLFPPSGNISSTMDMDITLIICLLRNLHCFKCNKSFDWNTTPASTDVTIEADICRLKRYRNNVSHISTTTGKHQNDFINWWNDIQQIFIRQSIPALNIQQTIADLKTCPLDPDEEKRIQKEIERWKDYESDVDRLKGEMKEVKENVEDTKKNFSDITEKVSGIKRDIEEMKRRQDVTDLSFKEGKKTKSFWQNIRILQWIKYLRMKNELKNQLIKFYKRKQSTIPLSPLVEEKDTPLAGFYVMPDMVTVKQNSLTSGQEKRHPVKSLGDLFLTEKNDQQEIYLSADAGFGKTSFSKYLAIAWGQACCPDINQCFFKDDELKALSNFGFLFLVLLRDVTAVCSIDEMIEQQIIKKLPPSQSQYQIQEVLRREKCLIILDGLDEWAHPNNACSDQKEKIPHRYERDNCVILTTSRPWKLGVLNLKTSDINKKIELIQLSKDATYRLERNAIRKMSGVNDFYMLEEKTLNFKKVIASRGLEHMQTIPSPHVHYMFVV